ncbi:hypothetical protein HPB49_023022 [Dermacentor silvarum]|uniref:Uncharacterized protein n=1 Tax=Dermacentor silvarum TaxID=543639 RepID=A0ACB8DRR4_DERSI|nr:hypothetical protein HPB49_023022 [Dermacentor silvarum]
MPQIPASPVKAGAYISPPFTGLDSLAKNDEADPPAARTKARSLASVARLEHNASKTEVQQAVYQLDLSELEAVSTRKELCGRLYPTKCDPSFPYRSLDGSCNNIEHPSWGKALSCHARITPPVYQDGER